MKFLALLSISLCLTSTGLYAMQHQEIQALEIDPDNRFTYYYDHQLIKWDPVLYDNAYPGVGSTYSFDIVELNRYCEKALTMTKEQADEEAISQKERIIFDWFYALQMTQKKLLTKPFVEWTIKDLVRIATWLNRLTVDEPGCYRDEEKYYTIKNLNDREKIYVHLLLHRAMLARYSPEKRERLRKNRSYLFVGLAKVPRPLTPREQEILNGSIYLYPLPETVEEGLTLALKKAQEAVHTLERLPWTERQKRSFTIGAQFHVDCMRIHPFRAKGNKRLGRLVMHIILMQHGIKPASIVDRTEYIISLVCSLYENSCETFEEKYREIHNRQEQLISDWQGHVGKKMGWKDFWKKISSYHNLSLTECSQLLEKDGAAQAMMDFNPSGKAHLQTALRKCLPCGSTNHEDLKACAGCEKVYYCSRKCQKKDWPSHKLACQES